MAPAVVVHLVLKESRYMAVVPSFLGFGRPVR